MFSRFMGRIHDFPLIYKIMGIFVLPAIATFVAVYAVNKDAIESRELDLLVTKSRAIATEAENVRDYVGRLHGQYKAFDEASMRAELQKLLAGRTFANNEERLAAIRGSALYWTVPHVASWYVATTNAEKSGYEFRVIRNQPRNPKNEPTHLGRQMLDELIRSGEDELYRVDPQANVLRYLRAVRLTPACMGCHGTAADDPDHDGIDPFGFRMEGRQVGEAYAAFEVASDLRPMQAGIRQTLFKLLATATVVGLLTLALTFYLVRRNISRPLAEAAAMMGEMSRGHLERRLRVDHRDEIGRMSQAMDRFADDLHGGMVDALQKLADGDLTFPAEPKDERDTIGGALLRTRSGLNDLLSQIHTAVGQVAIGSSEISNASQSLAQGATEQAATVEEITSTMTELASQTRLNATNSGTANQLASTARERATQGSTQMKDMVAAMAEINASSRDISKIIKVIDDIAFQTNLLALNAAVEAARAGKYGRGFAVVAEEVRNLAARSAKAAQETSELIERSTGKVQVGAETAGRTAQSLAEIVTEITKVSDLVGEIAAASNEQAQAISQVSGALDQIAQVTNQNTASSEELAASSEELTGQAEQTRQLLGRFRLLAHDGDGRDQADVRPTYGGRILPPPGATPAPRSIAGPAEAGRGGASLKMLTEGAEATGPDDRRFGRYSET